MLIKLLKSIIDIQSYVLEYPRVRLALGPPVVLYFHVVRVFQCPHRLPAVLEVPLVDIQLYQKSFTIHNWNLTAECWCKWKSWLYAHTRSICSLRPGISLTSLQKCKRLLQKINDFITALWESNSTEPVRSQWGEVLKSYIMFFESWYIPEVLAALSLLLDRGDPKKHTWRLRILVMSINDTSTALKIISLT